MLIRSASERDLGLCRRLIPGVFPLVGRSPELLVCEDDEGIAGVSAVAWIPRGFPVLIHVEPRARRRGIGRALMAASAAAVRGETPKLVPWGKVTEKSENHAFLLACGFAVVGRLHVFELDPAKLRQSISHLAARVRKRIPSNMRLVPPRQAPREPLLELISANLTTPRPYLEEALFGGGPRGYDQELSRVVLVDESVAGAVLAHRQGTTMEVDLNVVDPAWRRGWVNLTQVDAILQNGHTAGLTGLRFLAAPHVKNTINLAERGAGNRLSDLLTCALNPNE